MTPPTETTTAAPVDNAAAVRLAAAGFKDLADRADLFRQKCRELGLGSDIITRLDRLVFTADVGHQDCETTLTRLAQIAAAPEAP